MKILRVGFGCLFVVAQLFATLPVGAAVAGGVVISQLQTAGSGTGTAGQEFIEIYNNGATDVNITGWYITYSSASDASQSTVYRLTAPNAETTIWLKAKGHAVFVSPDYKTAMGVGGDGTFSYVNGMAATAGHVRLFNGSNIEQDKVVWGTTTVAPPEATASAAPGGKSLQRIGTDVLQDTDNSAVDFVVETPVVRSGGLYEVVTIIDVCSNLDGVQSIMPAGYLADAQGNCQPDSCVNIAGLQTSVPTGYDSDGQGNCFMHDECSNITGVQAVIPDNMLRGEANDCVWDIAPLWLTELLPNATGDDTGNEFVEIYNPGEKVLDLSLYGLKVGTGGEKLVKFPAGSTIAPGEYRVFSDKQLGVTFVNTNGQVVLYSVDGTTRGDSGVYVSAPEGQSWSLINGVWQYTNQPTPGLPNRESQIVETSTDTTVVSVSCPAGKYRNPLTNRCRNIEADASVLATCSEGQYRNPETGRCRKIVTTTLTPCKEDQYRSEETNRCRAITTASTQKPCKDNQYRSEETNRCRTLTATSVPESSFAVQPIKDAGMAFIGWWALGGVSLLAIGYAGWEWRREIAHGFGAVVSRFSGKR